jgi:hypothetical protein
VRICEPPREPSAGSALIACCAPGARTATAGSRGVVALF